MRLIDADELYRKFCGFEDSISESDMDKISATISSMPTAYDLDKVVEQLEKLQQYKPDLADAMSQIQKFGNTSPLIRLYNVIEIVKGGGVNEM